MNSPVGSFSGTAHVLGDVTLLGRLVQERIGTLLEPHGLTHAQAVALVRLWRSKNGSMRQAALINSLAVSRATGTQLLQDLEARGLVARSPDDTDARRYLVAVTDTGAALEPEVLAIFDQVESEIAGPLLAQESNGLAGALASMTNRARRSKGLSS